MFLLSSNNWLQRLCAPSQTNYSNQDNICRIIK
uniref:Uncharacterized protein n=1 Tax=Arundo donax TaxID=35708 RepID=A0A0A9AK84_ARUDO